MQGAVALHIYIPCQPLSRHPAAANAPGQTTPGKLGVHFNHCPNYGYMRNARIYERSALGHGPGVVEQPEPNCRLGICGFPKCGGAKDPQLQRNSSVDFWRDPQCIPLLVFVTRGGSDRGVNNSDAMSSVLHKITARAACGLPPKLGPTAELLQHRHDHVFPTPFYRDPLPVPLTRFRPSKRGRDTANNNEPK